MKTLLIRKFKSSKGNAEKISTSEYLHKAFYLLCILGKYTFVCDIILVLIKYFHDKTCFYFAFTNPFQTIVSLDPLKKLKTYTFSDVLRRYKMKESLEMS